MDAKLLVTIILYGPLFGVSPKAALNSRLK